MPYRSPVLATLLAIASMQAVASDLVTSDCRYVGPPIAAARQSDLVLACMRENPRYRRVFELMLDDPPPAPSSADQAPAAGRQAPEPMLDLQTGRIILPVPVPVR